MPDKPLTVLTYAASASLAAVALVYFFNPNYLFDGESSSASASTRKKGIVGLFNPANDCFINCVLQSLAGLGDLRLYLIREVHRRELGGPEVYTSVPVPNTDANGKVENAEKLLSLQRGDVTQGLKEMIDRLNERPIYKKTISANSFVRVLEHAFQTRISKAQQDAQELLQIVTERLAEEYTAGREARKRFSESIGKDRMDASTPSLDLDSAKIREIISETTNPDVNVRPRDTNAGSGKTKQDDDTDSFEEEDGFPLEGRTEERIECQHCHFKPKVRPTSFVMLNLMVPQKSSSTLNDCFDAQFKTEYIDDYICDKCRLEHAVEVFTEGLEKAKSGEQKASTQSDIDKLKTALQEDPEKVPEGVTLPASELAPKRKITRHAEIITFPKVLVIHLSRSIFDSHSSSIKNLSKLAFPESFPVGGILKRRNYKLLGVVSHKGTHNSGHYETFRKQHSYAPYSTPHLGNASGPYSASPTRSSAPSPDVAPTPSIAIQIDAAPMPSPSTAEHSSLSVQSTSPSSSKSQSPPSTRPSSGSVPDTADIETSKGKISNEPQSAGNGSKFPNIGCLNSKNGSGVAINGNARTSIDNNRFKRKKKPVDRWWRISDDKIKECKTSEVLSMHKGAYILFYEMERDENRGW